MSAEQFLNRVEATGLIDDALLAKLRKQVAAKPGATPQAVAQTLIKAGHLTKAQAAKLLADLPGGGAGGKAAAPQPAASSVDDDLGLAPLDDEEPQDTDADDQGLTLLDDDTPEEGGLEPVDDGLQPIDDGLEPVDSGLEPIDGGLEPVDSGLEPVDDGLEPIDSGLEPVDSGLEPVGSAGGLEPIDSGLEPIEEGPVESRPATLPGEGRRAGRTNQWDSTLLYVGGGLLVLLIIVGVGAYFLINRQTAGEMFKDADDAYRGQSYSQAIPKFEKYLAKFPDDPNASLARVKIGTAKLWQKLENRDKTPALEEALATLPEIENESAFSEVRAELATILPEIASGFATPAKEQEDVERAQGLVDLAEQAMELVNTPAYIPTSIRRPVEGTIAAIEEDIQIAKRNINRSQRLAEALSAIRTAASGGQTVQAFQIRRDLLSDYPELEANSALQAAVAVVTESEQSQVQVSDPGLQPATEDPPAAAADFRLALASRPDAAEAPVADRDHVCFLARGALYGLQAKTGELLWRRYLGYESILHPQRLTPQADSDLLAADLRRQALLRLKAETGELVWACPIGEPFADPVVDGKQIYVPAVSGRVFVVEAETGGSQRSVRLPQPLSVGPGIGDSQRLYQVGLHSNVYVLDRQTLECREVYYLGHRDGTVVAPPAVTLGYVLIAENAGQDYCDLHVLASDANGMGLKPAMKPIRLAGRVVVPPIQSGSRLIVVTDLGQVRMLEINASDPKQPLMDVVDPLPASFRTPRLSYSVFDAGRLWIGNSRFSRYDIQTSRNRMDCPWIRNERDVFVAPPVVIGDTVFHLRRRESSAAYTASAINGQDGKAIWEIDLAVPLALVAVDMDKRQIDALNVQAELFEITTDDFGSGRLDRPSLRVIGSSRGLPFEEAMPLDASRWVLASRHEPHKVIVYDPAEATASGRLQARVLASVGDAQVTALPTVFQGGLLVPLDSGQVLLADPASGEDQLLPFQPRVEAGRKIHWRRPCVVGAGEQFVIADDRKKVYRVGVDDAPSPHLVGLDEIELQQEIATQLAAAEDTVYAVVRGASSDTVVSLSASDLTIGKEWPLDGRVVWGPEAVGQLVLLTTDGDQLQAFARGQQLKWTAELPDGPLAGTPLPQDGRLILTSVRGTLWSLNAEDGSEGARAEIGEPLGAGAVPFAGRLLLSGSDGTLLVVPAL